ncbi:MAG: hypothetical protein NT163_00815 [Chlorobiales bacterium]|nr:hypothetical protein [Chlorobiales bacterium]
MNLLILPGSGNPDASPLYTKVYDVISREAKNFGFNQVKSDTRYPGHVSASDNYDQSDPLTLSGAVKAACKAIQTLPDDEPFTILARSFGCLVALKLASHEDQSIRRASKNILWGPSPYWLLWQICVRDLKKEKEKGKGKGCKLDETTFPSIESFESLIIHTSIRTVVASGDQDSYCSPAYLNYLSSLTKDNKLVIFNPPVVGAIHEVTDECGEQVVQDYAVALFKEWCY